jgi:TB2/DP1, HVA22 family
MRGTCRMPLYYEAKLLFVVWLWHPRSKGAVYLYQHSLQPLLLAHEQTIDRKIEEFKAMGGDFVAGNFSKCVDVWPLEANQLPAAVSHPLRHWTSQPAHCACRAIQWIQANAYGAVQQLQNLQNRVRGWHEGCGCYAVRSSLPL